MDITHYSEQQLRALVAMGSLHTSGAMDQCRTWGERLDIVREVYHALWAMSETSDPGYGGMIGMKTIHSRMSAPAALALVDLARHLAATCRNFDYDTLNQYSFHMPPNGWDPLIHTILGPHYSPYVNEWVNWFVDACENPQNVAYLKHVQIERPDQQPWEREEGGTSSILSQDGEKARWQATVDHEATRKVGDDTRPVDVIIAEMYKSWTQDTQLSSSLQETSVSMVTFDDLARHIDANDGTTQPDGMAFS